MAPAHVRRAAAAAARRCSPLVHHGAAATTPLPRAAATTPLQRAPATTPLPRAAATTPLQRAPATTPLPRAAAAPTPLARAAVAPTPRALHHRAATPSSFTPRRRFTGNALIPVISEDPIPSFIRREMTRIESADIARQREIGNVVSGLTRNVTMEHRASRERRVRNAIQVGTVTWRVCTTVITVTVAAGAAFVQLAKPGWEAAAEEEACAMVTEKVGKMMLSLEEDLVKGVAHRRAICAERSLLLQKKETAVAAREKEIAAREIKLNAWDNEISKKEATSN